MVFIDSVVTVKTKKAIERSDSVSKLPVQPERVEQEAPFPDAEVKEEKPKRNRKNNKED